MVAIADGIMLTTAAILLSVSVCVDVLVPASAFVWFSNG
jgi:hypothetical protein